MCSKKIESALEHRIRAGQQLRLIRERRGYSQDHLAELMAVSRSTISKIENGKFSFSIDYLHKLSLCLEFSLAFLENSPEKA